MLLFIIATLPPIDFAAHDIRMLQTYSLDEAAFASQIRELLETKTLEVKGFTYGALYPYVGVVLATLYSLVAPVTDSAVVIILRIISIVAGLITAGCTFLIARDLYGTRTGQISVALVLSTPLVFKWSLEIHPDLLQLSFLTASLYFATSVARSLTYRAVSFSALFAGLAMGTKYGGAFLAPTILLALLLGMPGGIPEALKARRFWTGGALALVIFLGAFGLTNPYAILNPSLFLQDLSFTKLIVSESEGNALSWVQLIFTPGVGVVCGLGALTALGFIVQREWLADGGKACVLFWLCSYTGFLMGDVSFITGQYLLPIIPALSIIAAALVVRLAARIPKSDVTSAAITAMIVILHVAFASETFGSRTRSESENPVIAAGQWLAKKYDADTTTILYDTYAYIPSSFSMAETYFGLSYPVIQIHQPDLVVTRKSIRDRYADPNRSNHFRLTEDTSKQADFLYLAPQRYRDIHYTYAYLDRSLSPYVMVWDFGDVTVYAKEQKGAGEEKIERWNRISAAQKAQGVDTSLAAGAYSAFGHIHRKAQNWQEAKVQYGKAIQLKKDDILSRYDYARILAYQDSFDLVDKHIEQISGFFSEPADPWVKLGWDYYEMGEYGRSRRASLKAHKLQPAHPFALYNVALTYLKEGRAREADSAYAAAFRHNGLPPETKALLNKMIVEGSLEAESLVVAKWVITKGR